LDLSYSLRSHAAERLHEWVDALLSGRVQESKTLATQLWSAGYCLYVTQDLDKAKHFLRARYADDPHATYGIVASSKSKNLVKYGLDTGFNSRDIVPLARNTTGPWYAGRENSPPNCRFLEQAVTEFSCQGLELDGVLLAWGVDLVHNGTVWVKPTYSARNTAKDPHQLRLNSYRVLLTRARDGLVVFCPGGPEMQATLAILTAAGMQPLEYQA
jgi:hypothetical protein